METEQERLIDLYNKQADRYAQLNKRKNGFDYKWRRKLLSAAKGHVLEVSVGAGANFKFYPAGVRVTAVDISPAMVDKAKEAAAYSGTNAQFIVSSVEELDFLPDTFDTIVSTLSLCAYSDPIKVLQQFNRWCKKDGAVLLLEHGLSKYQPVGWLQHQFDGLQYRKIGCHADRDILQLVQASHLQIKQSERKMLGILHIIWATPSQAESVRLPQIEM